MYLTINQTLGPKSSKNKENAEMVQSLLNVSSDRGEMKDLSQRTVDAVQRIIETILQNMKAEGNFMVKCWGKVRGRSEMSGKLRIGIVFEAMHMIEFQHQMQAKDGCYEYRLIVPRKYKTSDFYAKFVKAARQIHSVIIGADLGTQGQAQKSEKAEQSVVPNTVAAVEVVVPVAPVTSATHETPNQKKTPRSVGFSFSNGDEVETVLSLLAERADATGTLTREIFDSVLSTLIGDSPSKFVLGQKLRRIRELGEIEEIEKGRLRIVKFDRYLKRISAIPSALIASVPTCPSSSTAGQAISQMMIDGLVTANAQATDQLIAELAKKYADAKELEGKYQGQLAKLKVQIASLQAEEDRIQGLLKTLAETLKSGGIPEQAARQLGKIQ